MLNFRPLIWRNAHPSVLAERVEDGTPPDLLQVSATTGLPDDLPDDLSDDLRLTARLSLCYRMPTRRAG